MKPVPLFEDKNPCKGFLQFVKDNFEITDTLATIVDENGTDSDSYAEEIDDVVVPDLIKMFCEENGINVEDFNKKYNDSNLFFAVVDYITEYCTDDDTVNESASIDIKHIKQVMAGGLDNATSDYTVSRDKDDKSVAILRIGKSDVWFSISMKDGKFEVSPSQVYTSTKATAKNIEKKLNHE